MGQSRFWSKVDVQGPDDCWEWQGTTSSGYGMFRVNGRPMQAHRVAYAIAHSNRIPKEAVICHVCDNPLCVNPAHLLAGTHQDNYDDMVKKGRGRHSTTKLNQELADTIRAEYATGCYTQEFLANTFGVSRDQINRIVNNKAW